MHAQKMRLQTSTPTTSAATIDQVHSERTRTDCGVMPIGQPNPNALSQSEVEHAPRVTMSSSELADSRATRPERPRPTEPPSAADLHGCGAPGLPGQPETTRWGLDQPGRGACVGRPRGVRS